MKLYCYWTSFCISLTSLPAFENCRFKRLTVSCTQDFCIFDLQWHLCRLFYLVYSLCSNIFVGVLFKYFRNVEKRSSVKPWSQDWLIAAGAYPGFCSMKRLEVFLLPLDGMLVHRRSLPHNLLGFPNNLPVPIYTPGREALWVKCLA